MTSPPLCHLQVLSQVMDILDNRGSGLEQSYMWTAPKVPPLLSLLEFLFPFLLVLDTTAKVRTGGHVGITESELYRGGKVIYLCPQKKQTRDLGYFNFDVSVVYLNSAQCLSFPFFFDGPNILLDIQLQETARHLQVQETSMGSYFTPHFHICQVLKRHIS